MRSPCLSEVLEDLIWCLVSSGGVMKYLVSSEAAGVPVFLSEALADIMRSPILFESVARVCSDVPCLFGRCTEVSCLVMSCSEAFYLMINNPEASRW